MLAYLFPFFFRIVITVLNFWKNRKILNINVNFYFNIANVIQMSECVLKKLKFNIVSNCFFKIRFCSFRFMKRCTVFIFEIKITFTVSLSFYTIKIYFGIYLNPFIGYLKESNFFHLTQKI